MIKNLETVLNCPICFDTYDDKDRIPIALICKHHLCKSCAEKMMKNQNITCHKCRFVTEIRSIHDFQRDFGKVFKEILQIYNNQITTENDKLNEISNQTKCEGENFTNIKQN